MCDETHMTLGVISDTHGLLRPEAVEALRGSDRILHAGDVGDPEILDALAHIAPVTAVRGNVDTARVGAMSCLKPKLSKSAACPFICCTISARLDLKPEAAGFRVVDLRPQPSAENRREERSPLFQSGQRRATTIQFAGESGKADD